MEKEAKPKKIPRWVKTVLTVTFVFYIWYFISTLLIPIAEFINIPNGIYLTFYKIINFPPAIVGFMLCVSLISTIVIILEFNKQKNSTKIFLTESMTFMLYFIIPIIF